MVAPMIVIVKSLGLAQRIDRFGLTDIVGATVWSAGGAGDFARSSVGRSLCYTWLGGFPRATAGG